MLQVVSTLREIEVNSAQRLSGDTSPAMSSPWYKNAVDLPFADVKIKVDVALEEACKETEIALAEELDSIDSGLEDIEQEENVEGENGEIEHEKSPEHSQEVCVFFQSFL